jgi:hypothetical protein
MINERRNTVINEIPVLKKVFLFLSCLQKSIIAGSGRIARMQITALDELKSVRQ